MGRVWKYSLYSAKLLARNQNHQGFFSKTEILGSPPLKTLLILSSTSADSDVQIDVRAYGNHAVFYKIILNISHTLK